MIGAMCAGRREADPAPSIDPGRLPVPLTSFVGRGTELRALTALVRQQRSVTATGPGGVGKTRLCLAAAATLAAEFTDGVTFVDLVSVTDDAMVVPALADAIGVPERAGMTRRDAVVASLRERACLLVIDNCEHVLAGARVFGDQAAGWVPFETPFAMARRIVPDDPRRHGELVDTLVVAWRDAWRILRGGPPVMTSLDVAVVRPADDTAEAVQAANRIDQLRWGVWLDGLREGTFTVPGRAERELADLAGACDVVGLAIRDDAETVLYRAAEQGPERPLAVTFRPLGDTDAERSRSVQSMWRGTRRAAEELAITSVTITPFVDHPPVGDGIVTAAGELKDSGQSFVAP